MGEPEVDAGDDDDAEPCSQNAFWQVCTELLRKAELHESGNVKLHKADSSSQEILKVAVA